MKEARQTEEDVKNEDSENVEPLLWPETSGLGPDNLEFGYSDGYQDNGLNLEYHSTGVQYLQGNGFSRYYPSLKHLIPIRKSSRKKKGTIGVDEAGLWSFITFQWMSKYIYAAYKKKFKIDDVPKSSPFDTCEYNVQRLELLWQNELAEKGPKSASLGRVTWRFMRCRVIVTVIIFCLNILLNFLSIAVFMRKLLEYAETENASPLDGVVWAVCLTASELIRSALYSLTWAINYRTAVRLRSACLALLYKKLLRLNSLGDRSIGELINIFALDGQRVFDLVLFGPLVVSGPLTVVLGVFYVWWLLGPWAVIGFISFLIFYPIQYGLSHLSGFLKRKSVIVTDKRITLMSEILHCIKLIKMYTWEDIFSSKLEDLRKKELTYVRKNAYCTSLSSSLSTTVPFVASIVTFLVHIAAGNTLSPSQAFSTTALFLKSLRSVLLITRDGFKSIVEYFIALQRFKGFTLVSFFCSQLRLSITHTQYGLTNIIDLFVSCKRMKKVLLLNETSIYWSKPLNKSLAISISDGTFERHCFGSDHHKNKNKSKKNKTEKKLKDEEKDHSDYVKILTEINFFAPKGKLIGICGQVGSGKSSLLSAVLGQMHMTKGKICREGTCAFVSQKPWLINATLKENILFGEKFNPDRYFKAVYCSCLNDDIASLPGGDDTEIGERGINLSGGQKQRIALARALYADRDIYLLDDPLSSVDSHVRSEIFERYIISAMAQKTVLLVTHQIDCLRRCNGIAVMKDGTVVERGTHDELMGIDGEYCSMVKLWSESQIKNRNEVEQSAGDSAFSAPINEKSSSEKQNGGVEGKVLITEEKSEKGSLKMYTILSYISACGGTLVFFFIISLMFINVGATAFSNWWLALWMKSLNGTTEAFVSNSSSIIDFENNKEFSIFYLVYALCIIFILMSNLIRSYFFTLVTLKASSFYHNSLFKKVIKTSMVFFETTPIGRIQNLFSKDIGDIESMLPLHIESLLQHMWQIIFAMLFICVIFPWFIIPMLGTALVFYVISKIFRVGMRDLKRMENSTRSPIFSTITTTVLGLETIHAFNKEKSFWQQFGAIFNLNTTCLFLVSIGSRWLAIRIDALAVFIVFVTSVLMIILHDHIPPAMAGLAIAYASTLSGMFQYMVRLMCDAEVKFLSVERINMYRSDLQDEGQRDKQPTNPPEEWPRKGSIRFNKVCLRYRENLPLVLNNISFKIEPGQKIGIIGRTGSGKTSLISALFRLVEISSGKISIDSIDISNLTLSKLRSKISVIPQDPILLYGPVRFNLDPSGKKSDNELWEALEKTKLKEKVGSMDMKLDAILTSSGDNLSVGERQLLCLARTLLKNSKIVILDEATSGIDHETETLVLDTVRAEFSDCTVLTVAHRMETITSSDKVLVVSDGAVVEFDEPKKLMENSNSAFSKLLFASHKL